MIGSGASYDKVIATRYRQLKLRAIAQFLAQVNAVPVAHVLERCVQQGSSVTRRIINGLGRKRRCATPVRQRSALLFVPTRSWPLTTEKREIPLLSASRRAGLGRGIDVSRVAREAIAFCVGAPQFDAQELPGRLTDEERWAIADALEETGLFTLAARD